MDINTISNIQAEQELLGAIMSKNNLMLNVIDILNSNDFYDYKHRLIYKAIYNMYTNNKPIDLITLSENLKDKLLEVGGLTYITELIGGSLGRNIKQYAEIIKEKSTLQ